MEGKHTSSGLSVVSSSTTVRALWACGRPTAHILAEDYCTGGSAHLHLDQQRGAFIFTCGSDRTCCHCHGRDPLCVLDVLSMPLANTAQMPAMYHGIHVHLQCTIQPELVLLRQLTLASPCLAILVVVCDSTHHWDREFNDSIRALYHCFK